MARLHEIALPLLLLGACRSAPEAAPAPFDTGVDINPLEVCETRNYSRYARGAHCKGVELLFLSREVAPAALLAGARMLLQTYGFAPAALALRVRGREQPGFSYHMGPADEPVLGAVFTSFGVPGSDESVEAHCYAYGSTVQPERCAKLFDAFVAQGLLRGDWPRVLDAAPRRSSISFVVAGRELRLPNACDELAPLDVSCEDGHVRVLVPDDAAKLAPLATIDLAVTKDETLHEERSVPCALEGVATTCSLRRFRLPYGDELLSYRAAAVVRGQPMLLSCELKRSRAGRQLGPICSQFFSFEEGVLDQPEVPAAEAQ